MDLAVQKGPCGQHHGFGAKAQTDLRHRAHHPVTFDQQVVYRLLEDGQVRLVFQHAPDRGFVEHTVCLGPRGAHGRALAGVENAKLNARLVGGQGHSTAQRIDLFDQMAFANAANRGVAAHLPQSLDVVGEQQGLAAHARSGQRSLAPGVAAADDDDVKLLGIKHGRQSNQGREGDFTGAPVLRDAGGTFPSLSPKCG